MLSVAAPLPGSWKGATVRRETLVKDAPSRAHIMSLHEWQPAKFRECQAVELGFERLLN